MIFLQYWSFIAQKVQNVLQILKIFFNLIFYKTFLWKEPKWHFSIALLRDTHFETFLFKSAG